MKTKEIIKRKVDELIHRGVKVQYNEYRYFCIMNVVNIGDISIKKEKDWLSPFPFYRYTMIIGYTRISVINIFFLMKMYRNLLKKYKEDRRNAQIIKQKTIIESLLK